MVKKGNGSLVGDKGDTTMNLLDSTDSDVEWLNLPPLKGKKPRKRKSGTMRSRDTSVCNFWAFMKLMLSLSVISAIVLLSISTVWLYSQLNEVKDKLKEVESKNAASLGDVEELYAQIKSLNSSLQLHSKNMNLVLKNVSGLQLNLTKLSGTVEKLGAGMKAAPELKEIPEKLNAVSKIVAGLGSDVSTMKDTVDDVGPFMKKTGSDIDDIKKQLDNVKQASSPEESSSRQQELSPELARLVQLLPQQLETMNSSMLTRMSVITKSLALHEERFTNLENLTRILQGNLSRVLMDHSSISTDHASMTGDDYSSAQFKSSVSEIVQHMLSTVRQNVSAGTPMDHRRTDIAVANITALIDSIKDLEDKYAQLANNAPQDQDGDGQGVSLEMLKTLGEGFEAKVENVNRSVVNLKARVNHLTDILVKQTNQLTNVSRHVTVLKSYMARLEQRMGLTNTGELPSTPVDAGSTTQPPKEGQSETGETKINAEHTESAIENKPTTTVVPIVSGQSSKEPDVTSTTEVPIPTIVIPTIHNVSELELNYARWDRQGSGQVKYEELPGFLGPDTPSEEALSKFDTDHDGLYSLQEFADALGYTLDKSSTTGEDMGADTGDAGGMLEGTEDDIPPR